MMYGRLISASLLIIAIGACKSANTASQVRDDTLSPGATESGTTSAGPNEIEVMSYNVENLYDTERDPTIDDWEFTPKGTPGKAEYCATMTQEMKRESCLASDWNPAKFKWKLKSLTQIISGDSLPDILGLVEVENETTARALANLLGYEGMAVTESRDKRGLDVAILYKLSDKLQFVRQTIHHPQDERFEQYPTRDVLEIEFLVNQTYRLSVLINHWPSQRTSPKARLAIAQQLHAYIGRKLAEDEDHHFLLMGDFNTSPMDIPHPFRETWLAKDAQIRLFEVHERFLRSRNVDPEQKRSMAPGTAFYIPDMSWSLLDKFFISTNLRDSRELEVDIPSYRIYTPQAARTTFEYPPGAYLAGSRIVGAPRRLDPQATDPEALGISDHFPIRVKLKF